MSRGVELMVEGADLGTVVNPADYPPSVRAVLEELARSGRSVGTKALVPHHRLNGRWFVVLSEEKRS